MKKTIYLFALACASAVGMDAQTLNVVVGNVTYAVPSSQAGDMLYNNGETLTVMGKTLNVADITKMYVDDSEVADNTVSVAYSGTSVTVTVAGNAAKYVEPTVANGHVSIVQSSDVSDDTCGEITYALSGSSTDGEFALSGYTNLQYR